MWNCTHFRYPTDEQLRHVFFSNCYNFPSVHFEYLRPVLRFAASRADMSNYGSKQIPQITGLASYLVSKSHALFLASPKKKILAPGVSAFHMLLQSFQKVSRNFSKTCWKAAQKPVKSCFLYRKLLKSCSKKQTLFWSYSKICKLYNKS